VVATSPPILDMRHIAKRFGSFVAIRDASFNIRRDEIHALVGENGAGKSRLMNILYGMFPRSGGEINFDGKAKNPARPSSEPLLETQGLTALGERGEVAVNGVSLTVRGEIVGLAGVQGNGQDELVECIAGLRLPTARLAAGARQQASALITQFDVRGAEPDKLARALSGGNQQKVQIARELTRDARVIVAEQPSQGVDIGKSVLVISADLDEIFSIADRILVLYRGRIVADVPTDRTTTEEVGRYMGGLGAGDAGEGVPT
jgi:general nucleoside transport system ATP-binding protein